MSNIAFALFHRTNRCRTCVWGGAIKIGARPFWGRGVFVLMISNINTGYQKSLTPPLKCPYYGLLKVHILVLGSRTDRTCMHGQKHFYCFIICIYFYLICSTTPKRFTQRFIFPSSSSSWRYSALIGRFHFSAAFCTALPRKQLCLTLQRMSKVAKNELAFSFRPMRKEQQVGGEYANDSCWRLTGIGLKTTRFNDSESTLSFERR